jgi:hypothetical protein
MSGGINESGVVTFTANGALSAHVRVKVTSASTTTPPQVEVAGAAEQHVGITEYAVADGAPVAVRLRTAPGIHEGIASEALSVGATLYAAAAGKVKDSSDGTAIGVALDEATANNDIIRFIDFTVISTTAATVSIADAGSLITGVTVEAALAEIMTGIKTAQGFVPIPLQSFREVSSGVVGNAAANGGVLASDTTPILTSINAATDGCQIIKWAASNNDVIAVSIPLPPDLDDAAAVVVHCRIVSAGTTDAVGFTVSGWFNEGDTKVDATSGTNQTTTWSEVTASFGASDVPAGAQTMTIFLTPVAHTTDYLSMSACWLEYTQKCLTS